MCVLSSNTIYQREFRNEIRRLAFENQSVSYAEIIRIAKANLNLEAGKSSRSIPSEVGMSESQANHGMNDDSEYSKPYIFSSNFH